MYYFKLVFTTLSILLIAVIIYYYNVSDTDACI